MHKQSGNKVIKVDFCIKVKNKVKTRSMKSIFPVLLSNKYLQSPDLKNKGSYTGGVVSIYSAYDRDSGENSFSASKVLDFFGFEDTGHLGCGDELTHFTETPHLTRRHRS